MLKVLDIRIYGDEILTKSLEESDYQDPFLKGFIPNFIHTMYERDGVGLAANQVGYDKRIIVIDPTHSDEGIRNPIVMLNPEILESSGEQSMEEGCLSLPGIFAKVIRKEKIRYRYTDLFGKVVEEEAQGYKAVVLQHEIDHLNGIVFTDRISKLARLSLMHKLNELKSRAVDGVNIMQGIPER